MDFSNRSTQPQSAAPATHVAPVAQGPKKVNKPNDGKFGRVLVSVVVGVVVLLVVALVAFLSFGGNPNDESKYVDTSKLQAVFLQTGQVYFGNVKTLNSKYVVLTNIYYLQTSGSSSSTDTTSSNTSVSLVKLGCELHQPYDQMVINQSQVTFWENLEPTGQVAKAVATFEKQNPNGQKCSDQSSSSASTTSNVQNANSGSTTGTGDTTTNP